MTREVRCAKEICGGGFRFGKKDEPYAVLTPFGPALVGPAKDADQIVTEANVCAMGADVDDNINDDTLSDQIRLLFRQDFIMRSDEVFPSEQTHHLLEDEQALKVMKDSIHSIHLEESKQYAVDIPWRQGR